MEFVCLFFGAVVLIIAFIFWNAKRVDNTWSDAAARMRLRYEKEGLGDRTIFGEHAGFKIRISTYKTVVNNSATTFTGYHIALRESLGLDLTVERQKTGKRSSGSRQDVIVGDPIFDPKVIITGSDENVIRDYLTSDRRRVLLRLFKQFDEYELDAKGIHVAKAGIASNASVIESNVNLLIQTVNELGRHTEVAVEEQPEVVPPPLPERPRKPVDMDAEIDLQPAAISEAEIEAARIAEIDALKAAQIEEVKIAQAKAAEQIEAAEAIVAEECAVAESRLDEATFSASQISGPAKITESPRIDNAKAREETSPVPTIDPKVEVDETIEPSTPSINMEDNEFAMLCGEVFDSGHSRFEIGKQFDNYLKGETKNGAGTLRKVEKFYSDLVFGRGPGIIAQIEITTLENGKSVSAHVQFCSEESDISDLRSKIGEPIEFSGKLLKCDVFNNRIYVGKPD